MDHKALDLDLERPFVLLRRKDDAQVHCFTGAISRQRNLADIPRRKGAEGVERFDSMSIVPFCQIRERGFPAHDAGEAIITLEIAASRSVSLDTFLAAVPQVPLQLDPFTPDYSDAQYEAIVKRILEDEIGTGQGSNFVIPRAFRGKIHGFTAQHALSVFRSMLVNEYGAYWNFLFFDGDRYFVGATPERHISAHQHKVKMNPISGTFRKNVRHSKGEFRGSLLAFLRDQKEIFELFMVVDEELKIMSELCEEGGTIVGPLLKEMSRLVHTEYLLVGHSKKDVIDLFRQSMYAPTVMGSPLLSAARVIHRYEGGSRSYYASAMLLIGRDADGGATLDAPITIRTLEIASDGAIDVRVGATLVRNSSPSDEVKETEAKIAGVFNAIQSASGKPSAEALIDASDEELSTILHERNLYLSRFWIEPQNEAFNAVPGFAGKQIVIIDNEDGFSNMLAHMLRQMGADVRVVGFAEFSFALPADLTVVGPGPGDPRDLKDPKMAKVHGIVQELLRTGRRFLAECLGHQILCVNLGFEVARKDIPYQGTQEVIDLFGARERVGFYNTFCGKLRQAKPGLEVSADAATGDIHAVRGKTFLGIQFHVESILTTSGYALLRRCVEPLLGP